MERETRIAKCNTNIVYFRVLGYKISNFTSTTTCGWFNGYVAQAKFTVPIYGTDAETDITLQVNGQINGSNQTQQSCSEGLTYNIAPTPIMVPAGCKAVVMQTLDTVDFSGPYNFSEIIQDGHEKFTTRGLKDSKKYYNTGYVDILDLVKHGTFPQSALIIESGNLVLQGSGTFKAKGFGQYSITYYFTEADPAHPHCNPNSNLLATQRSILTDKAFSDTIITVQLLIFRFMMFHVKHHKYLLICSTIASEAP